MTEQNRNFNKPYYDGNSTNNFINCDDSHRFLNQSQNSSHIFMTEMFARPPPPVFPNYQVPPASLSLPPQHLPISSLSVPPPNVPFQQPVQPPAPVNTDTNYHGNKGGSFFQFNSSTYYNQQLCQTQSVPLPALSLSHDQEFCSSTHPLGIISSFSANATNQDGNVLPGSRDKIDEYWIKNWLIGIGKSEAGNTKNLKEDNSLPLSELRIYEVKQRVTGISKLVAELENSCKSLAVIYKSLTDDEWKSRCMEIEEKKKRLSSMFGLFVNNKNFVEAIRYKLSKRKKKREGQKRKREEWKREKLESRVKCQQLHQSIDRWLEDMKDTVERGKRDEELKKEADTVLSDVTRKRNEAKRQIALLSELLKLREARVVAQKAIGRTISQQQTDAFNNVIERLKSLWSKQLKEYSLEEQGLKVMLNEAAAEEKNNESVRKKEVLKEWEETIFGAFKTTEYQPHDVNEFISVRKQWDQFVVCEGTVMSSSIPPGWVLPVKPSNSDWMRFSKSYST